MHPSATCTPAPHAPAPHAPQRHMHPSATCTHTPHRHVHPSVTCTLAPRAPQRHMHPILMEGAAIHERGGMRGFALYPVWDMSHTCVQLRSAGGYLQLRTDCPEHRPVWSRALKAYAEWFASYCGVSMEDVEWEFDLMCAWPGRSYGCDLLGYY
jgi:hypothetical protein